MVLLGPLLFEMRGSNSQYSSKNSSVFKPQQIINPVLLSTAQGLIDSHQVYRHTINNQMDCHMIATMLCFLLQGGSLNKVCGLRMLLRYALYTYI